MARKKLLPVFINLIFLASLAIINMPMLVQSSPSPVTFSVDMSGADYIPGKSVNTVFQVDILVDASGLADDSTEGIVTWGIDVEVDPDVLEVMGATGAGSGYFLYDFLVAHGYQFDYSVSLLVGSIDKAAGYMDEVAESIVATPPTGAGGTGTLVSLWFKSKSETAYSPIKLSISQGDEWQPVYKDANGAWHNATVIDGHYNQPPITKIMHTVIVDGQTYYVVTESNSTISNFAFNETYAMDTQMGETSFNVTGTDGTTGFSNVTIPKNLTTGNPWLIKVDAGSVSYSEGGNTTHTWLYFTYTHGATPSLVQIYGTWVVPEFSPPILLMTLIIAALAIAILANKRRHL